MPAKTTIYVWTPTNINEMLLSLQMSSTGFHPLVQMDAYSLFLLSLTSPQTTCREMSHTQNHTLILTEDSMRCQKSQIKWHASLYFHGYIDSVVLTHSDTMKGVRVSYMKGSTSRFSVLTSWLYDTTCLLSSRGFNWTLWGHASKY